MLEDLLCMFGRHFTETVAVDEGHLAYMRCVRCDARKAANLRAALWEEGATLPDDAMRYPFQPCPVCDGRGTSTKSSLADGRPFICEACRGTRRMLVK